jgi:hypothetical protein
VIELAGNRRGGFEFQKLHGMGEALYRDLSRAGSTPRSAATRSSCRIWCGGFWRTGPTARSCTR